MTESFRFFVFTACLLLLAGCSTPEFTVTEADTRFNSNTNQLLLSDGNRISSKSIAGGGHIDQKGVFVNPFVEKDRNTGRSLRLGITVTNKTSSDTSSYNINRLGTIQEIAFITDADRPIIIKLREAQTSSTGIPTYNVIGRYASIDLNESATGEIDRATLDRIASAATLSCKITGTIQSVTYEAKDISPSFQVNLRAFLDMHGK